MVQVTSIGIIIIRHIIRTIDNLYLTMNMSGNTKALHARDEISEPDSLGCAYSVPLLEWMEHCVSNVLYSGSIFRVYK